MIDMAAVVLEFRSTLKSSPAAVWRWITSVAGIRAEMRPWLRMTFLPGVKGLDQIEVLPGRLLFRSRLYLLGWIPCGHADLTMLEFTPGVGFVEQSPMTGMRLWRHERRIEAASSGSVLMDRLTFEPSLASPVASWFVGRFFAHRHAVLRKHL